jgi:hypothetical protein
MPFRIEDCFIFSFRLIAVAAFICSTLACFGSFHNVLIDRTPIVEQFFGYNCSELSLSGQPVCSTTQIRRYCLWGVHDDVTILRRQGLCRRSFASDRYGFNLTGSALEIVGGDLGGCPEAAIVTSSTCSVLTSIFALTSMVWITLVCDHREKGHFPVKVHLWLNGATIACSLIVICVYIFAVNPLRLESSFCKHQTLFSTCRQETGPAFWLQLSTLILCVVSLVTGLVGRKKSVWGYERNNDLPTEDDEEALAPRTIQRFFFKDIRFWIIMGRLGEFVFMLVGAISAFTFIYATVPAGSITRLQNIDTINIANHINLWQGVFCSYKVLWWSYLIQDPLFPFGECNDQDLFHVQFATMKVLTSSGLALVLKRDSQTNPFAF